MNVEALLAPIDESAPSGPDLEYDPDWQELERLAQGKPEQQFGDTVIAAEEPEWREVAKRSEALFARSKDVRNAVLFARSAASLEQFAGLSQGLHLIHQLMERFWQTVHPQLDASDNDDPTMRLNALAALADPQGLLRSARNCKLFQSRQHGELTVRQIELATGKATARADEPVPAVSTLEQQLAAVIKDDPELPTRTAGALASARALSKLLDDKVGSDRSPDLKPLLSTLVTVDQLVGRIAALAQGTAAGSAGAGTASDGGAMPVGAAGPGIDVSGAIRSRSDVVALLDRVAEFLERTEPTNPARMLVQRAKRIMNMDFIQLMTELAPEGLAQARVVTGVPEQSTED